MRGSERGAQHSDTSGTGPTGTPWGIIIAVFLLLVGVLLVVLGIEPRPSDGTALPISWIEIGMLLVVVCSVVVVIGLLRRRKGRGHVTARTSREPFDERLRRIERLRRDGLIDDGEYHRKRSDVLDEKW